MLKTVGFPSTRTGDQTIVSGNLVIGTSGKGIDFSATPGTGTSELLSDYEEGTWTPNIAGDATYFQQFGFYTKVGNTVRVHFLLQVNVKGTGSAAVVYGLPFNTANNTGRSAGSMAFYSSLAINVIAITPFVTQNDASAILFSTSAAASTSNTDVAAIIGNGTYLMGSLTYQAA
jgi:hypothetical protein